MNPQEITSVLQLNKIKDKVWSVLPTIAIKHVGLDEALDWLSKNTRDKK